MWEVCFKQKIASFKGGDIAVKRYNFIALLFVSKINGLLVWNILEYFHWESPSKIFGTAISHLSATGACSCESHEGDI